MTIDRRAVARDQFLAALRQSPQLMGILNVTPDLFSDGGRHFEPAAAVARAKAMVAEGAAIVDVGGESTRPGHVPFPPKRSFGGSTPVLEALAQGFDAPSRSTPARRRWRARRRGSAPQSSTTSGACSAIPAWRMRSPTPARPSSSCITASGLTGRSTFSTMSSASSNARSISRRAPACRSAAYCSILASASARRRSRTIPASGASTASAASARRSSSGFRASRSSAGSPAPRSTTVSPARSPPTRLRSCGALRCSGCMTWPRTAPRWTSSRR